MGRTTFSGPVRALSAGPTTVAGTGITTGTGTVHAVNVTRMGTVIKTEILVDITGLNCGGTANDIIGVDGTANSHIGQITAELNGTIVAGTLTCLEVPTTGDPDIDLWAADEATGAEDALITALTNDTQLTNGGDQTLGGVDVLTAFPADGQYLYLTCGTSTTGTYDAGKLLITLYGTA